MRSIGIPLTDFVEPRKTLNVLYDGTQHPTTGCVNSDDKWQNGGAMKYFINWFYGFGSALDLSPEARRYCVDNRGFRTDARRLRGDFKLVARNLSQQLKNESSDYSTGKKS